MTFASPSLSVPIMLWGSQAPSHRVSTVCAMPDGVTVLTGSTDGQLVVWRLGSSTGLCPQLMLFGHSDSVLCICPVGFEQHVSRFVSSSLDGKICLWESSDGHCVDSVTIGNVHRNIYSHNGRLFCIGDYAEVLVLDSLDLSLLFTLNSRIEPDWLSSLCISNFTNLVVGVSMSGTLKLWSLPGLDEDVGSPDCPLFETESKPLVVRGVVCLDSRKDTLLVVSASQWQIFDTCDFHPLLTQNSPINCTCVSGLFIPHNRVAICCVDGDTYLFRLPQNLSSDVRTDGPVLHSVLGTDARQHPLRQVVSHCFHWSVQPIVLYRASTLGDVSSWNLHLSDSSDHHDTSIRVAPTAGHSLSDAWSQLAEPPRGIADNLDGDHHRGRSTISCSLYLPVDGHLAIGRKDGVVLLLDLVDAVGRQLLRTVGHSRPTVRLLGGGRGHCGPVLCLLRPHDEHCRYSRRLLLSGGADFAVFLWDMDTWERVHRFCIQAGPVLRLLVPPATCNGRVLQTVCSVAADHSVALLGLKDTKCVLLASRHLFPVIGIRWRPLDDFLLIRCADDTVYVWQMETANLDRIINGLLADEIWNACEEQAGVIENGNEAGASPVVQIFRAFRNRNVAAIKRIATHGDEKPLEFGGQSVDSYSKGDCVDAQDVDVAPPMSVQTLKKDDGDSHLVLFHVDSLIDDSLSMHAAHLLLSLIHGWTLDTDLDTVCERKLGLFPPRSPVCFGLVSHKGPLFPSVVHGLLLLTAHLSLLLPTANPVQFALFASQMHWQFSPALTTQHLLTVIAISNALMSLSSPVAFTAEQQQKRRLSRLFSSVGSFARLAHFCRRLSSVISRTPSEIGTTPELTQIRQCWSLVSALHCVLLPELVRGNSDYCPPRIESLTKRWQDPCLWIREAARTLLVRELNRLGVNGRARLGAEWTSSLPPVLEPQPEETLNVESTSISSSSSRLHNRQMTSVVLLGVLGAEFPDFDPSLARTTGLTLLELSVRPLSGHLPVEIPLCRAAVDLLGRGFVVWEPHLDGSQALLGLLNLAAIGDKQGDFSSRDACKTARNSLCLIVAARPPVVITALSREVARYNSAAQHQTIQHTVGSPLLKARMEVLRIMEQLVEKHADQVGDILVHCLDTSLLKQRTLNEIFPPLAKFHMVSYCANTRRICFGGKSGTVVIHELRAARTQTVQAHTGPVTATAFSEDGRHLATYSAEDGQVRFWQTAQSFLGMGQSQVRCVKQQPAPPVLTLPVKARLLWISARSLTLMLPNGKEHRFNM